MLTSLITGEFEGLGMFLDSNDRKISNFDPQTNKSWRFQSLSVDVLWNRNYYTFNY